MSVLKDRKPSRRVLGSVELDSSLSVHSLRVQLKASQTDIENSQNNSSKTSDIPRNEPGSSRQSSLVNTGQTFEPQPTNQDASAEELIECPICNLRMVNLHQLNQHIDDTHLVDETSLALDNNIVKSNDALFDEDMIKSWIKNKIKMPNVKLFENNNFNIKEINNSLLNINDLLLTPNSSSSSLSEQSEQNSPKLAKRYRIQVERGIDKSKWQKLSPRHNNVCSELTCHNTIKYKPSNSHSSSPKLNTQRTSPRPLYNAENYKNNCFSCGKVFCSSHLQNSMKINASGKFDPVNGIWLQCCFNCYEARPCYTKNENSSGTYFDVTSSFKKMRSTKIEGHKLAHLKIYRRAESYLNLLMDIYHQYYYINKNSLVRLIVFNEAKRKLTNSFMSYWQDDADVNNCEICAEEFNRLLLRKHHCRLCGSVVCDNKCSMDVPVSLLLPLLVTPANQSLYGQVASKFAPSETLRICLNCKELLFKKKMFQQDLQSRSVPVVQEIEALLAIKTKVQTLMPKFDELLRLLETPTSNIDEDEVLNLLESLRRLLTKLLTNFEKTSKKILLIEPTSSNTAQLIASIRLFSLNFLQTNTHPLKSFQDLLVQRQKLSKRAIKIIDSKPPMTSGRKNPEDTHTVSIVSLEDSAAPKVSIQQIKELREELMILKEQQFLIEQMISSAKKERKFDQVVTLNENTRELESRIEEIRLKLGDEYAFS